LPDGFLTLLTDDSEKAEPRVGSVHGA
jgi:hypothetical protein